MAFDTLKKLRATLFLAMCRKPISWLRVGFRHKMAADALYEIAHSAYERFHSRWVERLQTPEPIATTGTSGEKERLEMELIAEYFILVGYALECVFKGYLLAILPDLVTNDVRLDGLVTTHRLRQLCRDCGISASEEELRLLNYISEYVIWGKYPSTRNADEMPIADDPSNESSFLKCSNLYEGRQVKKMVDGLFNRTAELLERQRLPLP